MELANSAARISRSVNTALETQTGGQSTSQILLFRFVEDKMCMISYLQSRGGQQHMCGLHHICSVDVVMVSYIRVVMILQGHHEVNEMVYRNLKRF